MCLEALLKVGGDPYITLRGDGKALEKIDILHPFAPERCCIPTYRGGKMACHPKLWRFQSDHKKDSPPAPRLRGTPFALKARCIPTNPAEKNGLPPEALEVSRASGGGADRDRTDDLLNAIQALSQLSYGPTI